VDISEVEWVHAVQLEDAQVTMIRDVLENYDKNKETQEYFGNYKLKRGIVYRKLENSRTAWLVPRRVRWQICRLCHDEMGHFAVEKRLQKIRENYWFAGMRCFITKYVQSCLKCQYYKRGSGKKQGMINPIEKVPTPTNLLVRSSQ
jgi:hypothetical protein